MCRLAFFPAGTKIELPTLKTFLSKLENSMGGDGNGYAAISPTGGVIINKAVKFDIDPMAEEIHGIMENGWHIYFHTRKTSIGSTTDNQCHPFRVKGPAWDGTLCHNGTWSDGGILARYFGCGSDTAAFAQLIGELGLEEIEKRGLMPKSGIWLLYGGKPGETKKTHTVLKIAGSLEYCPKSKIYASQFFNDWDGWAGTYNVKTGVHNLENVPERATYTTTSYTNGYSGYNHRSNNNSIGFRQTTNVGSLTTPTQEAEMDSLWNEGENSQETEEALWGKAYWYHTQV